MEKVILVYRHNAREIENEEKAKWVRSMLEHIGVPLDNYPKKPSMEDLRRMRSLLKKQGIDILNANDSGLIIYINDELVGQWNQPTYVLRENLNERDSKFRYYLEMNLNCYSIYEKE